MLCDVRRATCDVRRATCDVRRATCAGVGARRGSFADHNVAGWGGGSGEGAVVGAVGRGPHSLAAFGASHETSYARFRGGVVGAFRMGGTEAETCRSATGISVLHRAARLPRPHARTPHRQTVSRSHRGGLAPLGGGDEGEEYPDQGCTKTWPRCSIDRRNACLERRFAMRLRGDPHVEGPGWECKCGCPGGAPRAQGSASVRAARQTQ